MVLEIWNMCQRGILVNQISSVGAWWGWELHKWVRTVLAAQTQSSSMVLLAVSSLPSHSHVLPPLPLACPCPQTDRSNCDLLAGELSSGYLLKRRHQARASRQPTWTRWGRRKALIRFRNPYSAVCKSGLNVVIMRCTRSNVIGWQTRATSPTTSWIS